MMPIEKLLEASSLRVRDWDGVRGVVTPAEVDEVLRRSASAEPAAARPRVLALALAAGVVVLLTGLVLAGITVLGPRSEQPAPLTTPSLIATPSPAPTPAPTPTPTRTASAPAGFRGCGLGPNAFCPVEPECSYQYISNNDFPAAANPISCRETHTHQTFAAGRLSANVRFQSQLEALPEVRSLCRLATVQKLLPRSTSTTNWSVDALPGDRIFRCLVVTGESRSSPLTFR